MEESKFETNKQSFINIYSDKSLKNILLDLFQKMIDFIKINESKGLLELKKMGKKYENLFNLISYFYEIIEQLDENNPKIMSLKKRDLAILIFNIEHHMKEESKITNHFIERIKNNEKITEEGIKNFNETCVVIRLQALDNICEMFLMMLSHFNELLF